MSTLANDVLTTLESMNSGEKLFWFASVIGVSSTVTRMCTDTKNDWWIWMVLIQGFCFYYATMQCDEGADTRLQLPDAIHHSFCCVDCELEGYSNTERWIMMFAALIGIGANVVPKYWKGDEAVRHMVHVKKRKIVNPLLFHIVFGILTVVFGGALSLASPEVQNDNVMFALLFFFDAGHQISIHRLLKNHDGIWTLRCGNMQLAIMKMICLLRVQDRQTMIDLVFFQSCGFLGTRVFVTIVYILMYFGVPTYLFEENWYSIGLSGAQFWIYARMWPAAGPTVWLSIVASSALYFHQLWREHLHLRNVFVALNCVAMAFALSLAKWPSLIFTMVYWCTFFWLPGFKRQPLLGHLTGTLKQYVDTKSKRHAEKQERLLHKARTMTERGLDLGNAKASVRSMATFLNATELRNSLRASALMLKGMSASTLKSCSTIAASMAGSAGVSMQDMLGSLAHLSMSNLSKSSLVRSPKTGKGFLEDGARIVAATACN